MGYGSMLSRLSRCNEYWQNMKIERVFLGDSICPRKRKIFTTAQRLSRT